MPPAIIYRTTGVWGAGKGSNLTPAEVDTNFYELVEALAAFTAQGPVEIANIQIDTATGELVFIMEDATEYRVPVPIAAFRWRGDWQDGTDYEPFDLFTANDGLYFVQQAHSTDTGSEFNPDAGNMQGPFAVLMIAYPTHYDIGFFFPGQPGRGIEEDGTCFSFRADRAFYLPEDLPGSVGGLEGASEIEMVFPIYKNGDAIGSFTIGGNTEGSSSGEMLPPETGTFTFAADVQFNPGDRLRVLRPATLDYNARDLTITFAGIRGVIGL